MIPLILDEMQAHNWMNAEDMSNLIAIAEMTPGPLGINCATFATILELSAENYITDGNIDVFSCLIGILMFALIHCCALLFPVIYK